MQPAGVAPAGRSTPAAVSRLNSGFGSELPEKCGPTLPGSLVNGENRAALG